MRWRERQSGTFARGRWIETYLFVRNGREGCKVPWVLLVQLSKVAVSKAFRG